MTIELLVVLACFAVLISLINEETKFEDDPIQIVHTGHKTLTVIKINIPIQPDTAKGTSTTFTLPSAVADFDIPAKLNTPTAFVGWDADTVIMDCLFNLTSQARTYIRSLVKRTFPTMGTSLMAMLYDDFYAGLKKQPCPQLDEEGAAADTLAKAIAGLQYHTDEGTPDMTGVEQYIRRWVYAVGLLWSDKIPADFYVERFDATGSDQVTRTTYFILALAIYQITYLHILGFINSDKAMANAGMLEKGLISEKIPAKYVAAVDNFWKHYVKLHKPSVTVPSGYATYQVDPITTVLSDGATLDEAIRTIKTAFVVPTVSLQMAREYFGISYSEENGTPEHFAIILNGMLPTSSGSYDTHPYTWEMFINTAACLNFLEDMAGWNTEIMAAVEKTRHYTYVGLAKLLTDFFSDFNIEDSLKGIAESYTLKGIKPYLRFEDSTVDNGLTDNLQSGRDPQRLHNTGTIRTGPGAIAHTGNTLWIVPFLGNWFPRRYRAYFAVKVSDANVKAMIFYGMLTSMCGDPGSTFTEATKIYICVEKLVELINSKRVEDVECLMYPSNAEVVRYEHLKDTLDYTNYAAVALKYGVAYTDRLCANVLVAMAARPKGDDKLCCYIQDIGDANVQMAMLLSIFPLKSSSTPKIPAPKIEGDLAPKGIPKPDKVDPSAPEKDDE